MLPVRDILHLLRDICEALDGDLSLARLASRAGWSKFHLHRVFRRMVGETSKQYTQRLRLERAATALVSGTESVTAVALASGFRSHEVFSRAFRRHFGSSPSDYRARVLTGASDRERARHVELVRSIGPCVRLFHVQTTPSSRIQPMSTPRIVRKELPEQPILFIRRRVAQTQLQPLFAECFPRLYGHGQRAGLAIAGQPIARYVSTGQGRWTVDCVMPIAAPAAPQGEMEAGFLPAGPVAMAVHEGPYEVLAETHAAIEQWIEEQGLCAGGAPWESYITDPGQTPNPEDWITEVFWPISA